MQTTLYVCTVECYQILTVASHLLTYLLIYSLTHSLTQSLTY